jgi:hypothetical protein
MHPEQEGEAADDAEYAKQGPGWEAAELIKEAAYLTTNTPALPQRRDDSADFTK